MSSGETFRQKLEGIGWLAAWRVTRMLPERTAYRLFEALSARSFRKNHRRRRTVIENLAPVVGADQAEQVAREAFRWYGRYWAETFRMQDLTKAEIDRRFTLENAHLLAEAHAAGTGAVFATLHVGNWDAGGRWVGDRWGLTVVVEVLRPRILFDRFVAHRRSLGMTIIPLERGGDATAKCLERLAAGDLVALVADRDLSGSGVEVEMFGRRTKLPAGPAVLSLRSGAPLMTAVIYQTEHGDWPARVLPPIERPPEGHPDPVGFLTQRIADAFAGFIAANPAQWHVFSRYWIDG